MGPAGASSSVGRKMTRAASMGNSVQVSTGSDKSPPQIMGASSKELSLINDLSKLNGENRQLQTTCQQQEEDIHYLRMREKKIMHLVHQM